MHGLSPEHEAVVVDYRADNSTEAAELDRLRYVAQFGNREVAEAHKALAAATIREREAELEVYRAKNARRWCQQRVRQAEMQCYQLHNKLDYAEWCSESRELVDRAERAVT